jgi:CheY-like chemotaxis protein
MGGTHRILIVDDNTAIHRDFQKILVASEGRSDIADLERDLFGGSSGRSGTLQYAISCAENGQAALELVKRGVQQGQPFSMAFVDMRMPGWDGLETLTQLFRVQPDLQVAICSAYMDYSWHDVLARLKRPGLRLLRKPWTSGEVLALVHELGARAGQARPASSRRTV